MTHAANVQRWSLLLIIPLFASVAVGWIALWVGIPLVWLLLLGWSTCGRTTTG